jgi:hypothetical protein
LEAFEFLDDCPEFRKIGERFVRTWDAEASQARAIVGLRNVATSLEQFL